MLSHDFMPAAESLRPQPRAARALSLPPRVVCVRQRAVLPLLLFAGCRNLRPSARALSLCPREWYACAKGPCFLFFYFMGGFFLRGCESFDPPRFPIKKLPNGFSESISATTKKKQPGYPKKQPGDQWRVP